MSPITGTGGQTMRLIDADELIKSIEQSRNNNPHKDCHIKRNHDIEHNHFIKMVYDHPTAFNKEKVINELREELNLSDAEKERCARENPLQFDSAKGYANGIANAIEIVEKGGIE